MISIGVILERSSDYDHEVVAVCGGLCAIKPIKTSSYKSYAGVIAGLSLNPVEIPTVEPVFWYLTTELLTIFKIKETK